jgi:general secretion pathway protein K
MQRGRWARHQGLRGAAIVMALLTLALVSIVSASAYWQQWRGVAVETAERQRLQADWVLTGTLDWARVRLYQDTVYSAIDHPGERWAQAVRELPLGEFLAGASGGQAVAATAGASPAFLSMQISDAQGRLNLLNLLDGPTISAPWLDVFGRLFQTLNLPAAELITLADRLRLAANPATGQGLASLLPQHPSQLSWLGLPAASIAALQDHVVLLPARTPVNLNSASWQVLQAVVKGLSRAEAERLVAARQRKPFATLADTGLSQGLNEAQHSLSSRYFEVQATLRLSSPPLSLTQHALLQRDGANLRTLWQFRAPGQDSALAPALWPEPSSR